MSTIDSDSSEFWNLYKKTNESDSETSEFWNLYRKNYKKYEKETETLSESFSSEDEGEEPSTKSEKPDDAVAAEEGEQTEPNDLISVKIDSKKKTEDEDTNLPPKQIINGSKKIYDYTIIEFYSSFMRNIIDIVKTLKQGKGLNTLFNDRERLLHLGIGLIIISVILVPLALN